MSWCTELGDSALEARLWGRRGKGELMALPPELLAMVLARVRLSDLANLRLVSSVFLCNPAL